MRIVSNTSPLIALAKLNKLDLLAQLFNKIMIPQTVYDEFLNHCPHNEEKIFRVACDNFIEIVVIEKLFTFNRRLDLGEQEVLTLALDINADIVLIDDRKAFNEAKQHAIKTASTRAILMMAEKKGLIENHHALAEQLKINSFFIPNY